jgi:regulator of sigma E protease
MRVERFSLFFPPMLVKKQIGETEYGIGAIPLGGYVKISGMNPDQALPEEVRDRAYHAQPVWKRIVVIVAGPLVNVVIALLLLWIYFWQVGELNHYGVYETQKDYPAASVLQRGDHIVAVDGVRADSDNSKGRKAITQRIGSHRCARTPPTPGCRAETPARIVVERGGRERQVLLTPVYDPKAPAIEEGGKPGRMRVGFSYGQVGPRETVGPGKAFTEGLDRFWYVTAETVKLPARLFDAEKRKDVSSVVGGYEVTRQTILSRVGDVVIVMAVISLSLAIINLFPFLPLDGGHIFWACVEKIRRRPVPLAVMERASVIGFLLVIGVFLIGLSNDFDRLSGDGFQVR